MTSGRLIASVVAVLLCACATGDRTRGGDLRLAPESERQIAPDVRLPPNGVRFLAVGDSGSGGDGQLEVAAAMCDLHRREPFRFVVSTGDNVYQSGDPASFDQNFKEPYRCLTDRGARWHAVLGNHDVKTAGGLYEIQDPAFGMPARYYAWRLGPVRFTMLDSNNLDASQLEWMRPRLERARGSPWSVVVFHYPVYSGGAKYGSTPGLEETLGDAFARTGVDLVLNGHDHLYSRAESRGVTYLVTGGGGDWLYPCADELPEEVRACRPAQHFIEIEATPRTLTATALTPAGGVIERIRIRPGS